MTAPASNTDHNCAPRRRCRSILIVGVGALFAFCLPTSLAIAQTDKSDDSASPAHSPAQREGPREAPILTPRPRAGAASEDAGVSDPLRPPLGSLLREGAFIQNGRGRMVSGDSGSWVFIFDADAAGKSEPPMVLQPCIRLMEMRRLIEGKNQTITFSVSGQVFVYAGRNYLLPTHFTTVSAESSEALPEREGVAPGAGRSGAVISNDPRAADLLRELDEDEKVRPVTRPAGGAGAGGAGGAGGTGGGATAGLLREGLTIVQRRGRVERGAGGSWVFVSDSGTNRPDDATADAPLRISPNLILQEIERIARERGERQPLRISGQVFVYEDRNYLIPTVFQLEPDREGNLIPAQ